MPSLPRTPFSGDSGQADPELAARLSAYAANPTLTAEVLVALSRSRILVPIIASASEVVTDEAGLRHEKSADMEVVLWQRPTDGRVALLGFTSMETLRRWSADARPSPVTVADAARVALAESASALLVDVAGPVRFVVEHDDLHNLAAGHVLIAIGGGYGWATGSVEPGR